MSGKFTKRCIVNVATGRHVPLQKRLVESLGRVGYREGLLTWTDEWPPESPGHAEIPYGFKLFAIREAARRGYTSILWLDAPCFAVRPVEPVFEKIERRGHLLLANGEKLGAWSSDRCLREFGFSRDDAMSRRLMNGTFIGLNLLDVHSSEWFAEMMRLSRTGLFNGPYFSEHAPRDVRALRPGKPQGFVSPDPRCWGHRHDEAVGSCLAHRLGMPFDHPEDWLSGDCFPQGSPDHVFLFDRDPETPVLVDTTHAGV